MIVGVTKVSNEKSKSFLKKFLSCMANPGVASQIKSEVARSELIRAQRCEVNRAPEAEDKALAALQS
jgi:hypothetical protein